MATGAAVVVTQPEPELHHNSSSSSVKEELSAPALPSLKHGSTFNLTDAVDHSAAVANGTRASPAPNIPNGNAASPYADRGNPASQAAPQTVSSKDPKAAAQAANDMRNVVRRKLTGYVGFANLPNQWHRKSVRKGFNFNVMVVGKQPLHCAPFFRGGIDQVYAQVSLALENQHLSTPCSTPHFTPPKNERDLALTSYQKLSQFNRSAPTLKRTGFDYD
jgi:hypothetical protein